MSLQGLSLGKLAIILIASGVAIVYFVISGFQTLIIVARIDK